MWDRIKSELTELFKGFQENFQAAFANAKALTAQVTQLTTDLAARDTELAGVKAELATAQAAITAHATEISTLKESATAKDGEIAALKAEAKSAGERAVELFKSQGGKIIDLPAGDNPGGGSATDEKALRTKLAASTDPVERAKIARSLNALRLKK